MASHSRRRNCELVRAIILRHPDRTPNELWELATDDERDVLKEVQEIRRRATDLKHTGMVVVSGKRECGVKGTTMQTLRGG